MIGDEKPRGAVNCREQYARTGAGTIRCSYMVIGLSIAFRYANFGINEFTGTLGYLDT